MGTPLILFDIDGTLLRRSGPHHRRALEVAVREVTGLVTSTESIPVAGMLDGVILTLMMKAVKLPAKSIREVLPSVMAQAQRIYGETCPDLRRRVCPGVRQLLPRLVRQGAVVGLVTGNLSRIGWTKMEKAGLRSHFRFGAFAEMGRTRGELARLARRQAIAEGWITRRSPAVLIGDHINDIRAAREAKMRSVAVATGVLPVAELAPHQPDFLLDDLRSFDLDEVLR
ncbi:MAG: HAD hydrolase-like protein [Acidobacteria bacterium]|nr:HAD hydrolase-like protein [Acidobacteriota bacterium]